MSTSEVDLIHAAATAVEPVRALRQAVRSPEDRREPAAPAGPAAEEPGRKSEDPAAVAAIRDALTDADLSVGFFQVEGASSPVIRIYNRQTGEVVRQIPEDQVLRLRERFTELLGVLADRKA